MNRAEHLKWSKDLALAELDDGGGGWDVAISSLHQDFRLHAELKDHPGPMLMSTLAFEGRLTNADQVRDFIVNELR